MVVKVNGVPKQVSGAKANVILLIFGLFFLFLGLMFPKLVQSDNCTESADAVIVDYDSYKDSDGDTMHHTKYSFYIIDENGKAVQYEAWSSSGVSAIPTLGKRDTIKYNPDNPDKIVTPIDTLMYGIFSTIFLVVAGILLISLIIRAVKMIFRIIALGGLAAIAVASANNQNNQGNFQGGSTQGFTQGDSQGFTPGSTQGFGSRINQQSQNTDFSIGKSFDQTATQQEYPCPYCGKPVTRGTNPCPNCGGQLGW